MCRSLRILSILTLMVLAATAAMAAKVNVCHIPPSDPDNWHTISVSSNALAAHLGHGRLRVLDQLRTEPTPRDRLELCLPR